VAALKPSIPEAKRLERIRLEYLDGISLAQFHRLLTETDDYEVSYAGVRNYHTSRKAPVDYYAQVSRVFGIRLQWLLFGKGDMTEALSEAAEGGLEDSNWVSFLPEVAPTVWDSGDHVTRAALLDCVRRLELASPGTRPFSDEERLDLSRVLDTLVAGTLWILRGDRKAPRSCVRSILLAMGQGIPEPKQGSTHRGILKRMKI
jgi:hypothetical protein